MRNSEAIKGKWRLPSGAIIGAFACTALMFAVPSGAHATTYNLTIDHCTGGCSNGTLPFATVQVTQNGANLDFLVTMNSTYVFQKSTAL